MPQNPFGTNDPLAARPGGAWGGAGQGAGGFGSSAPENRAESYAVQPDSEEYDVVDIADTDTAPASFAKPQTNGAKGGKGAAVNKNQSIAAREAALAKREAEVNRREEQLRRGGTGVAAEQVRNFPKCWPIVHHDISTDIPEGKRGITRAGFLIFLMTCVALLYNMVAIIIAAIIASKFDGVAGSIILSIIYLITGVPGAWIMWYKRLYLGMARDGAISFGVFFCFFFIHIAWCIWSAIAPPFGGLQAGAAHTGFIPAIQFISDGGAQNTLAGILFFAGAGYWSVIAFLSFLYLGRVYRYFRGSPAEQDARNQVSQQAVNAGVAAAAARR